MDLKAIETTYKGYRFRSRAEARWAVAFDHSNIRWLYEDQGYDLCGEYYLPDFYLPDLECFIEVKGQLPEIKKIYFAGKVRPNDWRPFVSRSFDGYPTRGTSFEVEGFLYTGPFTFCCDHSCAHGPGDHGVDATGSSEGCIDSPSKEEVVKNCLDQIRNSSDVFVWIDEVDCFGSLVEAGFSHGLKKNLRVGVSNNLRKDLLLNRFGKKHIANGNELWFLQTMCSAFGFFSSPRIAFDSLFTECKPLRVCRRLCQQSGKDVVIVPSIGPETLEYILFSKSKCFKKSNAAFGFISDGPKFVEDGGLFAARRARFEHGEKG